MNVEKKNYKMPDTTIVQAKCRAKNYNLNIIKFSSTKRLAQQQLTITILKPN